MVYTKKEAMYSPATVKETSNEPNPKRRRLMDSSESDSEADIPINTKIEMVYTKKQALSSQDDVYTSRGRGGTRKAPVQEATNPKRRRLIESSELESDAEFSDFQDKTDNEKSKEPNQDTGSKQQGKRDSTDEKKKIRVLFTEEQTRLLSEMFQETPYPTKEQREKLEEETNLTGRQIGRWFEVRRNKNPTVLKYRQLTEEQTSKLEEAFAVNRRPSKATIAFLATELQLTIVRIKKFFENCRKEHGALGPIPDEGTERILMDIFKKNPSFSDYKNIRLTNKRHWPYKRLRTFFNDQRKQIGISNETIVSIQPETDPRFEDAMERIFQKRQFIATTDDTLEWETGYAWCNISAWLKNKRRVTLEASLKREISVLPTEMTNIERICKKYGIPIGFDEFRCIEQKENVTGFKLSDYLADRQSVLAKIWKEREAANVEQEEEESVEDPQDVHECQDEHQVVYHMYPGQEVQQEADGQVKNIDAVHQEAIGEGLSIEPNNPMSEIVQHVFNREAAELEFENDDIEFDNQEGAVVEENHGRVEGPEVDQQVSEQQVTEQEVQAAHQEAVIDVEQAGGSVDGQDAYEEYQIEPKLEPAVSQEADERENENSQAEFDHIQEPPIKEELLEEQLDEAITDHSVPADVKRETPEIDIKDVELLRAPVKQELQEPIENVEEEVEQLVVFDVMDRDESMDVAAAGPVVIERVQASFEDIQPDLDDIVGFPEIGFARKTEIAENKRSLGLENLTLPFNCSWDFPSWSKVQIKEFLCQLFVPATTMKLAEKVRTGFSRFQPGQKKFFEEKLKPIINWDQFLIICQEIRKLKYFNNKIAL